MHQGCRRGSVNLWTAGLKQDKAEICGNRHHLRIAGIGRILMIELLVSDPKLEANFVLRYQLVQITRSLEFFSPSSSTCLTTMHCPSRAHQQ